MSLYPPSNSPNASRENRLKARKIKKQRAEIRGDAFDNTIAVIDKQIQAAKNAKKNARKDFGKCNKLEATIDQGRTRDVDTCFKA